MSRFRRLASILAVVLVGCIVLTAAYAFWSRGQWRAARAAFEAEVGPLDVAAQLQPSVVDANNAAVWLQRAAEALDFSPSEREAITALLAEERWDPAQLDQARALLAGRQDALSHVDRAVEAPASSFDLDGRGSDFIDLDPLVSILHLRPLLALDGRRALAEGDFAAAVAATDRLFRVRTSLVEEPLIVSQLIGFAVDWSHLDLVRRVITDPAADPALFDRFDEQLAEPADGAFFDALAAEASTTLFAIDNAELGLVERWTQLVRRPDQKRSILHLYHRLALAARLPVDDVAGFIEQDRPWSPVAGVVADILVPNLAELPKTLRTSRMCRQLARTALAARRHAAVHGDYPATLEALQSTVLDDALGGPLQWTHAADGSAILASPEGAASWAERRPNHTSPFQPPFTWPLPAVGVGVVSPVAASSPSA